MTDSPAASRPSRSAARRARRKRAVTTASTTASGSAAPGSTAAAAGQQQRRPDRRPQHRRPADPYATPDTGGVIARSELPRPLTLCFELTDGERLLALLAADPASADLASMVAKKLVWTKAYNAALPGVASPVSRPRKRH